MLSTDRIRTAGSLAKGCRFGHRPGSGIQLRRSRTRRTGSLWHVEWHHASRISHDENIVHVPIVPRVLDLSIDPTVEQRHVSPRPRDHALVVLVRPAYVDHANRLGRAAQQPLGKRRREAVGGIVCHVCPKVTFGGLESLPAASG
jgi:hypothetical protein